MIVHMDGGICKREVGWSSWFSVILVDENDLEKENLCNMIEKI